MSNGEEASDELPEPDYRLTERVMIGTSRAVNAATEVGEALERGERVAGIEYRRVASYLDVIGRLGPEWRAAARRAEQRSA